jgi:hypothetical protein
MSATKKPPHDRNRVMELLDHHWGDEGEGLPAEQRDIICDWDAEKIAQASDAELGAMLAALADAGLDLRQNARKAPEMQQDDGKFQTTASGNSEVPPEADQADQSEAARLLSVGFKLCRLTNMRKRPQGDGWQLNPVSEVDSAASGYGILLAANGLASIDPDQVDLARIALAAVGFDLEGLLAAGVRTTSTRPGSGGRAAFKALDYLLWFSFRALIDGRNTAIFELRAHSTNLQDCCPGVRYQTVTVSERQEVLTHDGKVFGQDYHPDSKYRFDGAPALPAAFAEWWKRMSEEPEFRRAEEDAMVAALNEAGHVAKPLYNLRFDGKKLAIKINPSLRAKFNEAMLPEDIMRSHGYLEPKRKDGRWASPGSTGAPAIRKIPGHESLWQSDHQSDPLNGTFDAAQACVVLDHGYDATAFEAWVRARLAGLKAIATRREFGKADAGANLIVLPADEVELPAGATAAKIFAHITLNEEDVEDMVNAEFLIADMIVKGHIAVYPAPSGGGKTTLFIHFCEELCRMGLEVFYINVDSPPEMLRDQLTHAKTHGYQVVAPDAKKQEGVASAVIALNKLTKLPQGSLKNTVIILDTLKKFLKVLDKNAAAEFFTLLRQINARGATICLPGHTNKYLSSDGELVFEGVGDIKNDVDDMIFLYSSKDDDTGIQDITTKPEKARASFNPRSFRIHVNDGRRVEECADLLPIMTDDSRRVLKAVIEILDGMVMSQKDLINALMESTPFGRDKLRSILHQLAEFDYSPLRATRERESNTLRFGVRGNGPPPPQDLDEL